MKRLKDPIYGYIEIEDEIFALYIDTPAFQRLRRVVQTSYGPLYPAASHTRFVHSLGVYFLGDLAASAVEHSVKELIEKDEEFAIDFQEVSQKLETFKVACLLHDLGHAPFSHAGEDFYDVTTDSSSLDDLLMRAVDDERFSEDVKKMRSNPAASHERMSVILSLDLFSESISDKTLFARCITGYMHDSDSITIAEQLDNLLIRLLNSTTIDVDKLDYLIRDSFVVGFDSTSIDYQRLLAGIEIKRIAQNSYDLVFHRSAISVLENVVYARDFEKKWIQSHPVIIYDQFLLQNMMRYIDKQVCEGQKGKTLFCEKALKQQGETFPSGQRISLLCDDDVIYLAKNLYPNSFIKEYFNRKERRHPVWKSEAEFRALFEIDSHYESLKQLIILLHKIETEFCDGALILDEQLIKRINTELDGLGKTKEGDAEKRARALKRMLSFLDHLKRFCDNEAIPLDFAVIFSKGFTSGFNPNDFKRTKIDFSDHAKGTISELSKVSDCLTVSEKDKKLDLFYMYHSDAGTSEFPYDGLTDLLQHDQA